MYNGNKSDFSAYYQLNMPINVLLGDNTSIQITHYGTIYVQNLQINALHTPTLRYSLLSREELQLARKIRSVHKTQELRSARMTREDLRSVRKIRSSAARKIRLSAHRIQIYRQASTATPMAFWLYCL